MCCTISLIWRSLSWKTFFCKSLYWPILVFACNSQGISTVLLVQKRHVILNSLLIQKSTFAQFDRIPFCKPFKTRYKVKCGKEGAVAVLDWGGRGVIADICKSWATSAKSQPAHNVLHLVTKFFWTTASCCMLRIKLKIWYSDYICLFCLECYKVLLVQNFGSNEHGFAWFEGLRFWNTPFLSRCTENKYETMTFDLGEDFPVSYGMSGCGSRKCAAHYMHWVYTAVRLNRSSLFEKLCVECPLLHLTVEASKVSSKESDLSSPPLSPQHDAFNICSWLSS